MEGGGRNTHSSCQPVELIAARYFADHWLKKDFKKVQKDQWMTSLMFASHNRQKGPLPVIVKNWETINR